MVFSVFSCGGGGTGGDDGENDEAAETEGAAEAEDGVAGEDEGGGDLDAGEDVVEEELPPAVERALLVDFDLQEQSAWIDLADALDGAGIELRYRRFFPHVTRSDVEGEGAERLILVAAGAAPGFAGATMSLDELDELADFATGGGLLVLMPQPTRQGSYSGENDWYAMNRLLELLDSSMRIERASLLGPLFLGSPDPPHRDDDTGYATLLEFDIGYGWAFPPPGSPLAALLGGPLPAGRASVLRTRGDDVEVMLTSKRGANLWTCSGCAIQVRSVLDARPVAAVETIGAGRLAIVPRYLVTLGGADGQVSQHPAASTDTLRRTPLFLGWLVARLKALAEGRSALSPWDPTGGDDELFWVAGPGLPPAGEGETVSVAWRPSERTVAPSPPAGDLDETLVASSPGDPPPASPLVGEGGRIGYGGTPWETDRAGVLFAELEGMGVDVYVGGFVPERLVTGELSADDAAAMRAKMAEIGDIAATHGRRWLVGGLYSGHVYNSNPSRFPVSVGAQGQAFDAPPLLYEPLWDDYLIPAAVEVARAAAAHPGIAGILVDMEMYGTVLVYTDAQAFDDTTFDAYVATVADPATREALEAQATDTRLDTLIERGLLKDYLGVLREKAAAIGRRYREAVEEAAPGFQIALYLPGLPSCWQYRGLVEGMGTAASPVAVLTYDPWSRPVRARWNAGGARMVHVGGAILSNFTPADLTGILENCAEFTDGFWYFLHDEISGNGTGDPVFGTRQAYRDAIAAVD